MNKKIIVSVLLLTMLFANVSALKVKASETVAEKEGCVKTETTRAAYFVNQVIVNRYSNLTLSGLIDDVDARFGKIMDITGWSSEKFYGHKLEVTVDPSPKTNISDGTGGYGLANIFWGTDVDITNETSKRDFVCLFLHEMTHGITPSPIMARIWLAEGYASFLSYEVQVMFGDRTQKEADEWYQGSWNYYAEAIILTFAITKQCRILVDTS